MEIHRKIRFKMRKVALKIGVTHSGEKMRESRMRWFSHIQRIAINALVRKSELIQVEGTKKGRGKQRITSLEVVKKKCSIQLLEVELTFNRMCYHMTFDFGSVESSGAAGSKDVQYLPLLIKISSVHIVFLLDCFYRAPHHASAQCCLQF